LKINNSGRTVLYVAAESGLEDIIRCILHLHPEFDLNAPLTSEKQRYSLVHVASRYNHGHLVKYLASLGADLDKVECEHGYSPLTLSLVLGHCWAATELMLAGAAVRAVTSNGRTPMFVAAEKGLGEVIRIMVDHCQINVDEPIVLPSGLRLIHVAAFHRQPHLVVQLIELGANVNIVDDEGGYNPLTMAIIGGNVSSALSLIKAGANVREPCQAGRTAMYVAVEKGLAEVVRALITDCGVGVDERTTSELSAATALHVAVLHKQSHLVSLLIELGADVNLLDQEKHCSPLIMAILLQDEWSVRLLLDAKAKTDRLSREGRSPLFIAAEKDDASILRLLVERCNLDVNAPATNEGHKGSPLHIATMFNNVCAISVLLLMGANVFLKVDLSICTGP
jgi:ankyrin repeat protein